MPKKPVPDHVIPDEVAQTAVSIQMNGRLFVPVPDDLRRSLAAENGGVVPSYEALAGRGVRDDREAARQKAIDWALEFCEERGFKLSQAASDAFDAGVEWAVRGVRVPDERKD